MRFRVFDAAAGSQFHQAVWLCFQRDLRRHPDLMMKIVEILCARLRRTSAQVQELTFLNLPAHLAKALLRLTDKAQAPKSTPKVTITQREISQIIGRSREGTNKQLRVWAKQGLLRLEQGAVTVLRRDKLVEVTARAFDEQDSVGAISCLMG